MLSVPICVLFIFGTYLTLFLNLNFAQNIHSMANNLSEKKVEAAKVLYLEGYNMKDIGDILSINERTVARYANDHNWAHIKLQKQLMESNAIANLYEVFAYQADCLKKQKDQKVEQGDFTGFSSGTFDAMQKLYNVIRTDYKSYKIYARVMADYMEYMEAFDLDIAKLLIPGSKQFLADKQRALA
jgi:predicted transcriptional regulator